MNKKALRIVCVCVVLALSIGCDLFSGPRKGSKINERWETSNSAFKIRVTAYAEEGGIVGIRGAYYVFESAPIRSDTWREVMTYRHDDPDPIPRDQVRFVNDKIGYVFMVYKYAVTTDAGATWQTWYIVTDMSNWSNSRARIKDVKIGEDGIGSMSLHPVLDQKQTELFTKDYGRHWNSP